VGEVPIDRALVERLVATHYPKLRREPVREVRSTGTVNAIYRLGDTHYARLPRLGEWAAALRREVEWLPRLAPHLTLHVPEPVSSAGCSAPPAVPRCRAALDLDDATWARGRAYALHQAALIIPYYRTSNPAFTALAERTVEQIIRG